MQHELTTPKFMAAAQHVETVNDIDKRSIAVVREAAATAAGPNREAKALPHSPPEREEKCPVIRANQILFAAGSSGRTRVVYF